MDPRCMQSLKLIMTRREGGGRKENKKQKPCSNVGTALSDPRCRQSRSRNEADTLLLAIVTLQVLLMRRKINLGKYLFSDLR